MAEVAKFVLTARKRPRRRWTLAEKLAIVQAAKTSGDPVSVVARRHGMNANHLFGWLQQDRDGTLEREALYAAPGGPLAFVELGVVGQDVAAARRPALRGHEGPGEGRIEIDLPGGTRVRVDAAVDGEALRRVLLALKAAL
ncbi:MAG: IS66-like element accessory protein TnpA [Caulobacteraceae bacterium]